MRLIPIFTAQALRWTLVAVLLTGIANSQSTANSNGTKTQIYKAQVSTGQVIADTFAGTHLQGAAKIVTQGAAGWSLMGVGDFRHSGGRDLVYADGSTGSLAVLSSSGTDRIRHFISLVTPGAEWTARAIADVNGDGHPDVLFVNTKTGQVDVYFFGGTHGTTFVGSQTIGPLSATGWNLIGAADLNADGRPDLIFQNQSTQQVLAHYLGGPGGTTVTATQELTGDGLAGWTAAGMQDMNGDGHPDLILVSKSTGQSRVSFFGGQFGTTPMGGEFLDVSPNPGWGIVVPSAARTVDASAGTSSQASFDSTAVSASSSVPQTMMSQQIQGGSTQVLIFNGTGTSSTDVTAVIDVVKTLKLGYQTANSSQLEGMTQSQLAGYKLLIVPGGNSVTIGKNISAKATSNVHNAVSQNGLNYMGFCAGGFFGGFSKYNALNLTSGVWFSFYGDYYKGIHKEAVSISFPSQKNLDIYWQNGPDLSGWGSVVGKYPNGRPALTEGHWGKGFVVLSGVHPEAPASWRNGMKFGTPVDVDLAYAATLITAALNGAMLPHY